MSDISQARSCAVQMQWGVKIPLRDGVRLNATLYTPQNQTKVLPAIFTLTPYIGQTYHDQAVYYASQGHAFLTVDTRGRGNSEGEFTPNVNEGRDGFDVVEWLAQQPYCNGQVAMWGGSYGGHDQWMTAVQFPPHLAAIVPVASPYFAVDFPLRSNIPGPYQAQWLTFVAGRTSQDRMFWDQSYWSNLFRRWFESGTAFKTVDAFIGNPSRQFQEWVAHPEQGPFWDRYNPTAEQYAKLSLPILTITGSLDGDQPGALKHYGEHLRHNPSAVHYLVMGPWDHAGTRVPQAAFSGIQCGPDSLVNLRELHIQWYAWVMQQGPLPPFLRKKVAYYVLGAEKWRYTDTLEGITARVEPWYLNSVANPLDVFRSGSLSPEPSTEGEPDHYVYDPSDTTHAALESTVDPANRTEQRMVHALVGKQLVYHGAPLKEDVEISGFFKFTAWLAIDRPDTDFRVCVYEIGPDGRSFLLGVDSMRARYRESLRTAKLIDTTEPLRYDFERFMFMSRTLKKGSRLRLVIGPVNSIFSQKNYNSGGVVSEETMDNAQTVTVKLFHDREHPSALYVPYGHPE